VLTLCAILLALYVTVEAQQPKNIARIGYVFGSTPAATAHNIEAFRQGLRELGYVEGKTFVSALSVSGAILLILEMYTPYRSDYSLQRPTARGSRAPRAVRPMSGTGCRVSKVIAPRSVLSYAEGTLPNQNPKSAFRNSTLFPRQGRGTTLPCAGDS